jgi:hypothetical protein
MARIPGIKFIKDSKGNPKQVLIDLKKHGKEIQSFLEHIGAVEEDEFEKKIKNGISVSEAKERMYKKIREWEW